MPSLAREETLKKERSPLEMRGDLKKFAAEGTGKVSKDDAFRFKWQGLFHGQPHEDAFMVRIKTEGGRLSARQFAAVANLARLRGDPVVSLTTRQGLQIRGVKPQNADAALQDLEAAELTSACSGADNIRNITACPIDGLNARSLLDTRDLVTTLRQTFLDRDDFKNLPRKFNVALSACGTYCVHPEIHDLGFVAVRASGTVGFCLYIGGVLGRSPFLAKDFGYFIPANRVIEVACAAVELFNETGCRSDRHHARMAHLINEWGLDRFRSELTARIKPGLDPFPMPVLEYGDSEHDHLGLTEQRTPGKMMLGVSVPSGNLTPDQAVTLAKLSDEYGSGDLRITHHQNLMVTDIPREAVEKFVRAVTAAGFSTGKSAFLSGVAACTGKTHCKFGMAETKDRSVAVADYLEKRFPGIEPLFVHISGCQNGCGHHQVADIGLLGSTVMIDGKRTEAFDVQVGGGTGPHAALARTIATKVPVDQLNGVLGFSVSSFLRRRRSGETFQEFCNRQSTGRLKLLLIPWTGDESGETLWNRIARWQLSKSAFYTQVRDEAE